MEKVTSDRFKLVYEDIKKAIFNSFVFGSPLLLLILIQIQNGKSLEDIKLLVIAWILQAAIDLTKKFISVNRYQVEK